MNTPDTVHGIDQIPRRAGVAVATSVLATSLAAMGGDIDWKSTMVIAERQRDAAGQLLPLQSYDETIRRGMSFLLDDHLKWFKGPPEILVDEQGRTQANPLPGRPAWGDANLSKDGKTLYLHVMKWPADGKLAVEGVTPKGESVTFLAPKSAETKITFTQDGATLNLTLPGTTNDPHDTVVKVSLTEPFHPKTKL